MSNFTNEQLNKIWEKGIPDPKYKAAFVRKDACGAWMIRGLYGKRDTPFGWEVDHIYPASRLGKLDVPQKLIDDEDNLRPLNWKNNDSKKDDYPGYHATCKAEDDKNVSCNEEMVVNEIVQSQISELFKDYTI